MGGSRSQLQIHQGEMDWRNEGRTHVLKGRRFNSTYETPKNGWLADIPLIPEKLTMDGDEWPDGYLAVLYQPKRKQQDEALAYPC